MRFMVLVKANSDSEAGKMPSTELLTEMGKFNEELVKAGVMLAGEGLHPSSKGVRARYANGKVTLTDGPFSETKELVAGYWLWQCKSKDEAIEWLKRSPFQEGEVEIRPLFELEDFPVDPAEQPGGWREKEEQFKAAPPPARRPGTKRYLGIVKADKDTEAGVMPDEKLLAAMGAFMEEGIQKGIFLSGEGLQPSSKGARVRFSGSQRTVIDGPFTETKELAAGYAVLQFASKAEAVEWTKRFVQVDAPGRLNGESVCELRPIFDAEDFGEALTPELKAQEDRLRTDIESQRK
ncbi:MAG TPA: YciI family protein [Pirellulaceae bacterium]|nr:YciI family protein [Pirellulaceae bacterium]